MSAKPNTSQPSDSAQQATFKVVIHENITLGIDRNDDYSIQLKNILKKNISREFGLANDCESPVIKFNSRDNISITLDSGEEVFISRELARTMQKFFNSFSL